MVSLTIRTRKLKTAPLGYVLWGMLAVSASGQQAPYVRPGSFELGPYVGASYGIVNAQYMLGGNLTFAATRTILPYVEYSYFPQVEHPLASVIGTPPPGATLSVDRNISFSDFHAGIHLRIPIKETRYVPYLAFGVGALEHSDQKVTVTTTFSDGTSVTPKSVLQPGGSDFAVNGGGGLRIYLSQRVGLRAEAKVYKPTGTFNSPFGKVEFGIFYQFR
jgi:hypothetical protein